MKRGQLKRKKALPRGGPIPRKTPMPRGTGFKQAADAPRRDKPLAKQSKKRQRENRERKAVLVAKYGTGPVQCEVPWCVRWADDAHEILTRARGGSITDPANIRAVCRPCHDAITAEAPWAYEIGFLKHSWEAA